MPQFKADAEKIGLIVNAPQTGAAIAGGDRARLCIAVARGERIQKLNNPGELSMLQDEKPARPSKDRSRQSPVPRGAAAPRRGAGAGAAGARRAMRGAAPLPGRDDPRLPRQRSAAHLPAGALRRLRARLRRAVRSEPDARARLRLAGLGAHGARRQYPQARLLHGAGAGGRLGQGPDREAVELRDADRQGHGRSTAASSGAAATRFPAASITPTG